MSDKQNQNHDEQKIVYEEAEEDSGEDIDLDMAREKIVKMKEKLKKCSKEKEEYLDGWQRAKAEMVNYRRRQEEQMAEWLKMAQAGLISDLLPVIDTLEAGIRNWESAFRGVSSGETEGTGKTDENYLEEIKKQLIEILKRYGLEETRAVGEKFNPEFHEAIEQVESDKEERIIIEEIQKGYLLNGKVLRTSKVKVSRGKQISK